jgi:hypothetical protein
LNRVLFFSIIIIPALTDEKSQYLIELLNKTLKRLKRNEQFVNEYTLNFILFM